MHRDQSKGSDRHVTTTGHTLKVVLDQDTVCLVVVCHEPDGAFCRRACKERCQDVCEDPEKHIKPINYCLGAEWIALDDNAAECFAGRDDGELPLHDGMPVSLDWTGDLWEWSAISADQDELGVDDCDGPHRVGRALSRLP